MGGRAGERAGADSKQCDNALSAPFFCAPDLWYKIAP